MKLQIIRIADRGVSNKERLHMTVLADTNLVYFVVFDSRWIFPGGIGRIPRHGYWFPDQPVKAGDHIILYSTAGKDSSTPRSDGKTDYFLYWGLPNTLWNASNDCAVVFEVTEWQSTQPG